MKGRLEVIAGPMYAGKTSELIRRVNRAKIAGKNVEAFKPVIDDRHGDEYIGTHDGQRVKAEVVEDSLELKNSVDTDVDLVVVDEANFFGKRIVRNLQSLAYHNKRVIAAGTDQTFRGEPFNPMGDLMAVADRVDKLRAVCQKCGDDASMNQRMTEDGLPAHVEDETVKIGGNDIYEARCRHCHKLRGV